MLRAVTVKSAGSWEPGAARDCVVLDFDARHRRRIVMHGEAGLDFLLDLPEAVALSDGDGLELEDGGLVAVKAAPERMLWATNWPHLGQGPERHGDEAGLLDLLLDWAPDDATRDRILTENPAALYGF